MNVTHIAGGGMAHSNIFEAGRAVLANFCGNNWAQSGGLLPPIFIAKYTEAIDPITNQIKAHPQLETRRRGPELYKNVASAQSGELSELILHEFIENLIFSAALKDYGPFFAFRNFVFDSEKVALLQSLFPGEFSKSLVEFFEKNFSKKIHQYEFDYVCILPEIEVILAIEVKSSDRKNAKKQLSRLEELLNGIFEISFNGILAAKNFEKVEKFFIIKIIATPTIEEIFQPDPGFQYCTKTNLQDPIDWWNSNILPNLRNAKKIQRPKNPQVELFANFTEIFAALWAGKTMAADSCVRLDCKNSDEKFAQKSEIRFDCNKIDEFVQIGDRKVDQAHLSSRAGSSKDANNPINDVIFSEKSSVFRTAKGIILLYLTIEQHLPQ